MYQKDVIAAIATPPGVGAIAIIRISGLNLESIFKKLTKREDFVDRRASFLGIYGKNGDVIDKCMVIYIKGPNSYTGEDIIEINCHGGDLMPKLIISEIISIKGVRLATAGEFSRRAFLNNKIDLIQAESIASLIVSDSINMKKINLKNSMGFISKQVESISSGLYELLTVIEHELDFNEDEIEHITIKKISNELNDVKENLNNILNSSLYSKKLNDGYKVVLCGRPNVGKSSLFNAIVGTDRVIVSEEIGTTRDNVEMLFSIDGIKIKLIDTAGYMKTSRGVDQEAVKKTHQAINDADLLLVLDESNPYKELQHLKLNSQQNYLLVLTKSDLNINKKNVNNCIKLSTVTGLGLDLLLENISTFLSTSISFNIDKDPIITSNRQASIINSSIEIINTSINILNDDCDMVVISTMIRRVADLLGELIGVVYNEEVLNNIFTDFCVGK